MAKPSTKLNWTSFKNLYNNFKIATTMAEVTNLLKNFKEDDKHAIALGVLKDNTQQPPQWFLDYMDKFEKRINDRFDNLIKKNNLKE
ncbi:MAG: hypothetical protein MJ200_04835 [Mycoplasmoidaceae bacterium]|nr:hypothetical protein [Mycoplasmoidaceae bacterium]